MRNSKTLGVVVIKHKKTGRALRYTLPDAARDPLAAWNQKTERERYDAVMNAPQEMLFRVETLPGARMGVMGVGNE